MHATHARNRRLQVSICELCVVALSLIHIGRLQEMNWTGVDSGPCIYIPLFSFLLEIENEKNATWTSVVHFSSKTGKINEKMDLRKRNYTASTKKTPHKHV